MTATDTITLSLMALLEILAFAKNDRALYVLAGLGLIYYGFSLWATISYISILIVIAGIYNFARAIWAK